MNGNDASVRRVAIVMIGLVLCVFLICFTVVALQTDREMTSDVNILMLGVFGIAVLGGSIIVWRRPEVRPTDENDGGSSPSPFDPPG